MTVTFRESGSDATQDLSAYSATATGGTGTVSSDTGQAFTGARAILVAAGASAGGATVTTPGGILADSGTRIHFRMWPTAIAVANQFLLVTNSAGQRVFALRGAAGNTLSLNDAVGTTLGTPGAIPLTLNAWNRVVLDFILTSTTVFNMKTYIEGVADAVASSGTLQRVASDRFQLGMSTTTPAGTQCWFDDVEVDTDSTMTDPGSIRVNYQLAECFGLGGAPLGGFHP